MGSLRERTRLSTALNDIDVRIHSNLSFDEIMQSALYGFVDALRADAGDIKLIEGDEWVVRFEHGFGPEEVGHRLSIPDAPVAQLVRVLREPVTIRDYFEQEDVEYVGFPKRHSLRATLAVPLFVRDEVVGCLFAWMRAEPREFTPAEVDFGRRMATSVALAVENARLLEVAEQARERAENAEKRLEAELKTTRVLLRASDEFTATVDPDELLERLANVVIDATGIGRAFVNLISTKDRVLIPKVATGGLVAPGGDRIPFERLSETAQRAIQGKKTVLCDYELPDMPEHDAAIARANSSRLVLFVPLLHQRDIVGHIALDQPGERYDFSAEQIRVVESIAAQATVALENAQLFEREHRIAETLQQAVLSPPESVEGLEIAYLYQPASTAADVGGDFYDVVDLGQGCVALLIGDVAGKGLEAARMTTLIRDGARAYLHEGGNPTSVLDRLNALAYRFMPVEKFATVFLGVLNQASGELHHAGAGHPAPVVLGRTGPRPLDPAPGLLGAFKETKFTPMSATLEPGEVLVLFTDGVTEARHGTTLFGEEGVADALDRLQGVPVSDLPQSLLGEVLHFTGGRLRDDVAILCVARDGYPV